MNTHQYEEYQAKQSMRLSVAKALQSANPHLVAGNNCVVAAKNIRIELKRAFPGIKFSVKTSQFSMGNSVNISWTDGPTVAEVEQISDKYTSGSFNGHEDYYEYNSTNWTEAFGSAKYISCSRDYTEQTVTEAIASIGAKWHNGVLPTFSEYKSGSLYNAAPDRHCDSWQTLIHQELVKTSKVN